MPASVNQLRDRLVRKGWVYVSYTRGNRYFRLTKGDHTSYITLTSRGTIRRSN